MHSTSSVLSCALFSFMLSELRYHQQNVRPAETQVQPSDEDNRTRARASSVSYETVSPHSSQSNCTVYNQASLRRPACKYVCAQVGRDTQRPAAWRSNSSKSGQSSPLHCLRLMTTTTRWLLLMQQSCCMQGTSCMYAASLHVRRWPDRSSAIPFPKLSGARNYACGIWGLHRSSSMLRTGATVGACRRNSARAARPGQCGAASPPPSCVLTAWLHTQVFSELGQHWNAVQSANQAVTVSPEWAEAHLTLGRARLNYGEVSEPRV
jgi:hypothetical protein